jgi:beta-phosphoglucomutase-like phosphatase (HAD superfamily)
MYLLGMSRLGVTPAETLIVEDNENGVRAARASGAHVMVVAGPDDVTLDAIHQHIERARSADRVAA